MSKCVLLAAESLAAKNSGIGRVARLMAQVLAEHAVESGVRMRGVSLSDRHDDALEWDLITTACAGSRLKYVACVQVTGVRSSSVFYDSLSMARAHFMGPARWRTALAWMHGTEVWEAARSDHLKVARRIPLLVTNTEYTRCRAAARHAYLDRARVCWLGTESDVAPSPAQFYDGPPTVLIFSRIDRDLHKGHRELIAVWPEIQKSVPGVRLVIAGSGPGLEEVRALTQASAAAAHIELTGFVPEAELSALWARADVLAMPSQGEGFGLVYIEAMRYGIPVIASRQDAGQEVNVDGETGFNVDLDRPRELAGALIALLSDQTRARSMGVAGQKRWRQHFTYSAFKQRFLALLHEEGLLMGPLRP
ncbi:MAG: glycosyltransferase family 4 protein [Gammaproteobacteria bacterium]